MTGMRAQVIARERAHQLHRPHLLALLLSDNESPLDMSGAHALLSVYYIYADGGQETLVCALYSNQESKQDFILVFLIHLEISHSFQIHCPVCRG